MQQYHSAEWPAEPFSSGRCCALTFEGHTERYPAGCPAATPPAQGGRLACAYVSHGDTLPRATLAPPPDWLRGRPSSRPQASHRRAAAGITVQPFPQRPGRLDVVAVVGEQPVPGRTRFPGPGLPGPGGLVIPDHRLTAAGVRHVPGE